jgi:hypothetical protein
MNKFLVLSLLATTCLAACGSDDAPPQPAAGSSGASGRGGAAGTGGVAGASGGAGTSGAAGLGGSAGLGGQGGEAGAAGIAGAAGAAAGASGAASGGSAGAAGGAGAAGDGGAAGQAGQGGAEACVGLVKLPDELPEELAETGLYAGDLEGEDPPLSPFVKPYTPRFPLWSDGAEKDRFIYLPPCTTIDTTDPDHWVFPKDTRFWKVFRIDGNRVETRLIVVGDEGQVTYATYQNTPGPGALAKGLPAQGKRVRDGVEGASGTDHDIPSEIVCSTCHSSLREKVLGFGAVQLDHENAGQSLAALTTAGRLTMPIPAFTIPGDETTVKALGYLHSNCGNCHHDKQLFPGSFDLRLSVTDQTVDDTGTYQTAIGKGLSNFKKDGITLRIAPGDAATSAVTVRMAVRGTAEQMPQVGTKAVDDAGLAAVTAWIDALPPAK